MMTTWTITNKTSGVAMGDYSGATPEDAYCAMLRDAGYKAAVVDGEIVTDAPQGDCSDDFRIVACAARAME